MAGEIILVDTSILIDYFRKSNKDNSTLISLIRNGYKFQISAVTEYEIYAGSTSMQRQFWDSLLEKVTVVPFDQTAVKFAVEINYKLKLKSKQIAIPDLFIAATALSNNFPVATLNRKHFDRIEGLMIID